ncbi:putative ricin B-like lectin [Helianthus anomalus]
MFVVQVELVEYNPDKVDESVLWTQSKDLGDGFHAVRVVNNIKLNVDAWNGDKEHGGVRDGTEIYLWGWTKGDNQRWTTAPFCKFPDSNVKKKDDFFFFFL